MPGKGKMTVTGNLRDVMKELISAAASYVRSRAVAFGIEPPLFDKRDIHVHVPEGATPKDGPSAGVAMVTAIVSVMTGIPVRRDVAMTGEITLRGRVLPIGGLKEKLLAARARRHQDGADPGGERQGPGGDLRQHQEAAWRSFRCRAWTRCWRARWCARPKPIVWDEESAKAAAAEAAVDDELFGPHGSLSLRKLQPTAASSDAAVFVCARPRRDGITRLIACKARCFGQTVRARNGRNAVDLNGKGMVQ